MNFSTRIFKTRFIFVLISFLVLSSCDSGENTETNAKVEKSNSSNSGRGVPVEVLALKRGNIEQSVPLTGVLQPLHAVEIVAEISGKVEKIYKKLGEQVSHRDTLARIDDRIPLSQYRQAISQVLSTETNLEIAKLNLKSDEELYANQDISKLAWQNAVLAVKTAEANHLSAMANLSTMKKRFFDTRLTSPIDGLVSRKYINLGTMVNPGDPIYRVVDLSTLKVEVGIPQAIISRIALGSSVRATISALQNNPYSGKVQFISPQADETTGAFTAEVHIKNSENLAIRAGMTARIELRIGDKNSQLVIPDHAIVRKNGDDYVYIVKGDLARLAPVQISENIGSQVIVGSGLEEGDKIVVVGMKNLGVETKVWIESEN
ncbi:MAG: efflux RND transporter periplasmic adaptor subunit [Calditrichaeota bacterium]|nr:MAG: efflux RND transporter periplasmic adaptor subunit [Calditrichota bacterium]